MADLFDMRIDGAGWHLTSHLIAIAALFVACFAITGYITFRDDSVPGDALKDQDADFKDINADTLTLSDTLKVTGATTLTGDLSVTGSIFGKVGELITTKHSQGGFPGQGIVAVQESNSVTGYNYDQCEKLFNYLATKDRLTVAEITTLFGTTATTPSSTGKITAMAAADVANNGMDITLGVQFLTGGWGDADADIGSQNPFANLGLDNQQLVVFGGNTSKGTSALTLSFDGDSIASDYSSIAFSDADNNFTITAAAGGNATTDIVLTPADGTIIKKGSFLYLERINDAGAVSLRGFLKIGGVSLTSATC